MNTESWLGAIMTGGAALTFAALLGTRMRERARDPRRWRSDRRLGRAHLFLLAGLLASLTAVFGFGILVLQARGRDNVVASGRNLGPAVVKPTSLGQVIPGQQSQNVAQAMLDELNRIRVTKGSSRLALDLRLVQISYARAVLTAQANGNREARSVGGSVDSYLDAALIPWDEALEQGVNSEDSSLQEARSLQRQIATNTPPSSKEAGPLDEKFDTVGIGAYIDPAGKMWISEILVSTSGT